MQNVRMNKALKWVLTIGFVASVLVAAGVWGVQTWLGSADFKARVEQEALKLLGVGVTVGTIKVSVWPQPAVVVTEVEVQTRPAMSLAYVALRPELGNLLTGDWSVGSVLVRDATLPQHGIDALFLLLSQTKQSAHAAYGPEAENGMSSIEKWLPRELLLKNVTWTNAKGLAMTVDMQAKFSNQGESETVNLQVVNGYLSGATALLTRHEKVWTVALTVGGGNVTGPVEFDVPSQPGGPYVIKGQLTTQSVEVAALSTVAQPVLSGKLNATTTLTARTRQIDTLSDVIKTQSQFTVNKAVLHGIDLAKAVTTVGISRGGDTSFDRLEGQVTTQGKVLHLHHLTANFGVMSASGQVRVAANRALSGELRVNLAASQLGGAVGVPLEVGGTLEAPQVNLSRGAVIGAAIGTLLMPGVGTGAGASLGDRVGEGLKKLFGQ